MNAGTIAPLTAFQDYNVIEQAVYPYIIAQTDPQECISGVSGGPGGDPR